MNSILTSLNSKQKDAVTHIDGPLLIIAGAGSGKTKTLTHRIAHLIQEGIPGYSILAITFTNKAAEEMRERIKKILLEHYRQSMMTVGPFIGTFHSFCNRILRNEAGSLGYNSYFTILDEDDSLSLLKEIQKEFNINPKQFPAGMVSNIISRAKSELIDDATYKETAGNEFLPKTISNIYSEYQKRLRQSNSMDFDDLIMNVVKLFENNPSILEKYQDQYRYIHIDEYQDTNVAQFRFVELLAEKYGNVAVVGDDAQSIYSFRHADYRNILNFEKDWPNAKVVILDENYRSTQTILDAASDIISKNTLQKKKRLWTEKKGGHKVIAVGVSNEKREAEYIVHEIQKLQEGGLHFRDTAVLYRTNAQSRIIEEIFLQHDIPYTIIGGIRFYARKEIKDLLAYLRYAVNKDDAVSLKRIINIPPRKIGKRTLLKFLMNEPLKPNEKSFLLDFEKIIEWLRENIAEKTPSKIISELIKKLRYEEYLEDISRDPEIRLENIREFVGLAKRYDEIKAPEGVYKMLEDIALYAESENKDGTKEGVQMMTLHAAKGLEFPIVFITGLEEGILPHSKSIIDPPSLEEERRLLYVGITRAKEKAYLLYTSRRTLFGSTQVNIPSRFLGEISEESLEHTVEEYDYEDDIDEY